MADFSILDCDVSSKDTIALSPYYIDFNIDRIVKEINVFWKEDVSSFYRYFPSDEKGQEYRKAVYEDVCREGMYELLKEFRENMKLRKKFLDNKELTRSLVQKMVMTLSEIKIYTEAVKQLTDNLAEKELHSEGMVTFRKLLTEYVSGSEFQTLREKVTALRDTLDAIPLKLSFQDRFLNVTFEEVEGRYDSFLKEFSHQEKENQKSVSFFQRRNPLGDSIEITEIESEVLDIVYKRYPQFFKDLKQFTEENEKYAREFILLFSKEISFYLSFYCFAGEMEERGLYFTMAQKSAGARMVAEGPRLVAERPRLVAEDLYDLALACQLSKSGNLPVPNDITMEEGENFFVLTGPNQGGKTTFARSLGQLVFFSKLGLPVPAKRAQVPFYSRILTHFSVEESVETGKGKLAEELSRLAPMMEDKSQVNDFVVINELFTTAANYDACIMGKRVLDHFIGQNCHGIYVTHLQDLSKEDPGIVSLRAMMNEEHKQNFKIVRSTAPALESSILLVEKHRLQYEQVLERLKGEEV